MSEKWVWGAPPSIKKYFLKKHLFSLYTSPLCRNNSTKYVSYKIDLYVIFSRRLRVEHKQSNEKREQKTCSACEARAGATCPPYTKFVVRVRLRPVPTAIGLTVQKGA